MITIKTKSVDKAPLNRSCKITVAAESILAPRPRPGQTTVGRSSSQISAINLYRGRKNLYCFLPPLSKLHCDTRPAFDLYCSPTWVIPRSASFEAEPDGCFGISRNAWSELLLSVWRAIEGESREQLAFSFLLRPLRDSISQRTLFIGRSALAVGSHRLRRRASHDCSPALLLDRVAP
jgi:hypothetical protein